MRFLSLSALLLCCIGGVSAADNRVHIDGKDYFLNGVNIPWNVCGADVGTHPTWGNCYNPTWFENTFTTLQGAGVNSARLWLHADGRASPEFDSNGFPWGVDSQFYPNLDDILNRARNHGIKLILVLWSFEMIESKQSGGPASGGHSAVITDWSHMYTYLDNVLKPMAQRYKGHQGLLAFEVFNEPEWAIAENPDSWTSPKVGLSWMQAYISRAATYVHQYSDRLVTMGSACLKYSSPNGTNNYWSDANLKAANGGDARSTLDFREIHYYDWMAPWYTTWDTGHGARDWYNNDGKPTIIGEWQGNLTKTNTWWFAQQAYNLNWAGSFAWSFNANDGAGVWTDFKDVLPWMSSNYYGAIHP